MENKTDWLLVFALCLFVVFLGVSTNILYKFATTEITAPVKK